MTVGTGAMINGNRGKALSVCVMAGDVPGAGRPAVRARMAGTRPAMTMGRRRSGHDDGV
jgi:hypothetical protein